MDVIKSEPHTIITDIKDMIENNTQKEIVTLYSYYAFIIPLAYMTRMDYRQDDKTIKNNLSLLSIRAEGIDGINVKEKNVPLVSELIPLTHIKPNKLLKMMPWNVLFWKGDNIYDVSKKVYDIHNKIVQQIREISIVNILNTNFELLYLIWKTLFYILYYSSYTPLDAVWNQLKMLLPTTLKYIVFIGKHGRQFTQDDIHDILTLNDDARLDLLMNKSYIEIAKTPLWT